MIKLYCYLKKIKGDWMIKKKKSKKFSKYKKRKMQKKTNKKTILLLIILVFLLLLGVGVGIQLKSKKGKIPIIESKHEKINYQEYFFPIVVTETEKVLYKIENEEFVESGIVFSNVILSLIEDDYLEKGYFKIQDIDYYIDYKDIKESESISEDYFWKNYVPFNESIYAKETVNLYKNNSLVYSLKDSLTLPIVIKEDNYYGVIYKENLYYVKKEEYEVVDNVNTELKHTNAIAALVYHFVYNSNDIEEKNKCLNANSTICLSDLEFERHLKYIKDNGFYTATMKDIEMFVDKKIQLPEKTTVITIDDGYFVSASINMLEKYDLHATLFLIGTAGNPEDYKSNNLEIHSHTWNMHNGGKCSGGQGSEIKCLPKDKIIEDLKKSRESLNNTTYFCWPFFEYNDYAINTLQEAGFTMAFIGGRRKITPGMNKMILPRYGVTNTTSANDIARMIN